MHSALSDFLYFQEVFQVQPLWNLPEGEGGSLLPFAVIYLVINQV